MATLHLSTFRGQPNFTILLLQVLQTNVSIINMTFSNGEKPHMHMTTCTDKGRDMTTFSISLISIVSLNSVAAESSPSFILCKKPRIMIVCV